LGGGAKRRLLVDCVSFSYSTEVLRGTCVGLLVAVREPEAHAVFGFVVAAAAGCCMLSRSSAANVNAFAILTVVSFTLHFSGLGGEVMVRGPTPGPVLLMMFWSRCLRRAYRTRAGSSSNCCVDDVGLGGDRVPSDGALI
jgi:hypothetical protein